MANIKDIAKSAGVSVTTVSRVLNDHPYVRKEKREAVLRAIEEFNYQRNINAVHLSKGETFLVGVAIPYTDVPYFGLMLEGIANEAVKNNYKLVLFQTNYEETRELEALKMLQHKQIDALIICSRSCEWEVIDEYVQYGPIVLCEDARGKNVSSTFIDHYKCFFNALEYLHNKGHQKIGYCVGRKSGANSKQREKAYKDFLKKENLSFDPHYIFYDCNKFEDGVKVIEQLTRLQDPPTVLLVTSDIVAAGIITCCKEKDIAIPGDLSIMGFDNQPIAQMMHITTLEIPLVEIGRKLFRQSIGSRNPSHEEIMVKLIERQTI
ncbi:LacI family DNA-binding transcriptional regulator [Caldibacillus lycopersici]|uniref:LacI family DNA-binding transcriptional regulator n=1 Tax=Perspicuibacillus lycopersici TaxID=1325689 RepID=A0AAE3IX55_9BACI|nr:LacI family DNA-binding transcriptional regulator [Perspicuibacillus lycopersici]MCU9614534.1 LacI family DNA-binding transcriptional regulator [Perspicuibacillus lycopersici]